MLVRLSILLALGAALCAPAAHAAKPGSVRVASCIAGEIGLPGVVRFAVRMDAVPGTRRMALRFRLFERHGDRRFRRAPADGLDIWRKSRPGVSAFRYEQGVAGLRLGAIYRVVVHFRWYGAGGELIRAARVRSPACRQPGALPNLRIAGVRTRPGQVEGTSVYRVKVVNRSDVEARSVGVLLRVDGEVVDEAETIDLLQPGEARVVTFNGPPCRRRLTAVVDPKGNIAESRERDNARRLRCL